MSDDTRARAELAFFGRMTASTTHEINNCIAIIGEVSGLLQDLCLSAAQGHPVETERLCANSEKVGRQVARIQDVVKRLNRFAHTVDNPRVGFDPYECLRNLIDMCQRFASNRGVTLTLNAPSTTVSMDGDPFGLQRAVFMCVDAAMDVSGNGGSVTVTLAPKDATVILTIACSAAIISSDSTDRLEMMRRVVDEMGGTAVLPSTESDNEIRLEFPVQFGPA